MSRNKFSPRHSCSSHRKKRGERQDFIFLSKIKIEEKKIKMKESLGPSYYTPR